MEEEFGSHSVVHSVVFAEMLQLAVYSGRSDSEEPESWPLNDPLNRPLFTSICRKSIYKSAGKVYKIEKWMHKPGGKTDKSAALNGLLFPLLL